MKAVYAEWATLYGYKRIEVKGLLGIKKEYPSITTDIYYLVEIVHHQIYNGVGYATIIKNGNFETVEERNLMTIEEFEKNIAPFYKGILIHDHDSYRNNETKLIEANA